MAMCAPSTVAAGLQCTAAPAGLSWKGSRIPARNHISMVTTKGGLISLRSPRFRVFCAAKPETVSKVMQVVKQQLALPDDTILTPESKFTDIGADSLDTVEIVMTLEEEFEITVEEDNSQNIATIQDAADLIEKLVGEKAA